MATNGKKMEHHWEANGNQQKVNGKRWSTDGEPTENRRRTCGKPIENGWNTDGIPTENLWKQVEARWKTDGTPMQHRWKDDGEFLWKAIGWSKV